jgi:lactate dehydrogenase-like 2-hydroxyacid dehydrogenase
MKIVNLATDLPWTDEDKIQLKSFGDYTEIISSPSTEAELITSLGDADYALLSPTFNCIISHQIFDKTPNLKGISLSTTRFDWIDTEAAAERNIAVANLGQYAKVPVGEFAIALMFAIARRITVADRLSKAGFGRSSALNGLEIRDKVLGVIGMGSIGSYVAQIGQALGMQVIAHSRTQKDSTVPLVSVEYLLQNSDIIIVCLALNAQTQYLLNTAQLSLLKSAAIVISIAREGIINQEAMYQLLIENRIGGYAFELDEPRRVPIKEELVRLDNVIATPYTGWYTSETVVKIKQTILSNVQGMIDGCLMNNLVGSFEKIQEKKQC